MKKQNQLGMNPSTASHRLVKDILFQFIKEANIPCYRCGLDLTRESFSIEHKEPWLDSEDPRKMFFDLNNISFSHKSCNYEVRRSAEPAHGGQTMYRKGCRCNICVEGIKKVYKAGNRQRDEARAANR